MSETTSTELASTTAAVTRQQIRETSVIGVPSNLAEIIELAKVMAASGFYTEARQPQQAAALMILGAQYGIPPAQALTAIHVVKGKPMLHYSALLSKVRQHPDYDYEITEETDKSASVQFYRKGKPCGLSTFTIEQARKQQTQNLEKFPSTMLLARAVSNGVRRYCPDVLNGMPAYTHGEVEEDESYAPTVTKGEQLRAEMLAKTVTTAEDPITVDPVTGEVQQTLLGDGE